jgi:flagellar basal body-associated protein FliL
LFKSFKSDILFLILTEVVQTTTTSAAENVKQETKGSSLVIILLATLVPVAVLVVVAASVVAYFKILKRGNRTNKVSSSAHEHLERDHRPMKMHSGEHARSEV